MDAEARLAPADDSQRVSRGELDAGRELILAKERPGAASLGREHHVGIRRRGHS